MYWEDAGQSCVELSHLPASFFGAACVQPPAGCCAGAGSPQLLDIVAYPAGQVAGAQGGGQRFLRMNCCNRAFSLLSPSSSCRQPRVPLPNPSGTTKRRGPHHSMYAFQHPRDADLWTTQEMPFWLRRSRDDTGGQASVLKRPILHWGGGTINV